MQVIASWTGAQADALRQAMRLTNESFADRLGISVRAVAYWRKRPDMVPQRHMQEILDSALEQTPDRTKAQFALLVGEIHNAPRRGIQNSPRGAEPFSFQLDSMTSREWTTEDARALSQSFDAALERSAVEDIERLSHMWLICDAPQKIELGAGRLVSDELVSAVEHRVIQLRRADDFITGAASRELVRGELEATLPLLSDGALTEGQARRILIAVGEIAQLGAWVSADGGLIDEAARYVRGGVLAARAAGNAPLAANIISTFSYQVANTANPNEALVLARTAYQGGQRDATPVTRTLLLERVAWAAARSGNLRECERILGMVDSAFSAGPDDNDPDWVYWLNREEIDVMAGRCYTELRKPDRAEKLLSDAMSRYGPAFVRENSLYLSWLAEDYVQLGEIDHAAGIATQMAALAARTSSARTDTRLRYIARQLAPYRGTPRVTDFFDACQTAAEVPPPRHPD
jgi:transcriptional regulator with XRE-family HTH domain